MAFTQLLELDAMNRCPLLPKTLLFMAACACLVPAGALFPTQAQAQGPSSDRGRTFPQNVQRGEVRFIAPMQFWLNGSAIERLAPGARVYNENNLIVMTGTLVGEQTFAVNYLRDPAGTVRQMWLLTKTEASVMPDGSPLPNRPIRQPAN